MTIPKRFLHSKLVLLLISLNALCVLLISILVLLRLDSVRAGSYIVQYRNLGVIGVYKRGSALELVGFVVFGLVIFVLHLILSIKMYPIRHQLSLVILGLGLLLLVLALIVSNALLILR